MDQTIVYIEYLKFLMYKTGRKLEYCTSHRPTTTTMLYPLTKDIWMDQQGNDAALGIPIYDLWGLRKIYGNTPPVTFEEFIRFM